MRGEPTFSERREHLREADRNAAARNPATRPGRLRVLVATGSVTTRYTVASRNDLRAELQRTLAFDERPDIREAVARNRRLRPDVAHTLSTDTAPSVLYAVAANPATPAELLVELADRADQGVRAAVAANPATPDAVCHRLLVPAVRAQDTAAIARAAAGWPTDVVDAVTVLIDTDPDLDDDELLAVALATVQPAA